MIITIQNNNITACIDTLGAQLISLKDKQQTEYIWQRDPAHWVNCSPLLFPIVGNCRNDKTMIEGVEYEIPKHGFCKISEFAVEQPSDDCAIFTLTDSESTKTMYPYAFKLSLTYTLTETGVSMDYQVENTDNKSIHYLIGTHPGFICPLEDGEAFSDYVLEFEHEEAATTMFFDVPSMQFDTKTRRSYNWNGNQLPLNYEIFADDAIFFDNLTSRKVALKNPETGKGIEVAYPDFCSIAFWTPPTTKAPFLCIEPWNGSAIYDTENDDFLTRHDLQSLTIGEKKSYHLGIKIL